MHRNVYERVRKGLLEVDPFFREGRDCVGNTSTKTDEKIVAALHQISLGVPKDSLVEMLRISESLIHDSRRRFTTAIIKKFELKYLRKSSVAEAHDILQRHAKLGFPGSFGSLDCSSGKLNCGAVGDQQRKIGKSGSPEYRLQS